MDLGWSFVAEEIFGDALLLVNGSGKQFIAKVVAGDGVMSVK